MKCRTTSIVTSLMLLPLCSSCALLDRRAGRAPADDPATTYPPELVISGHAGLPDVNMTGFPNPVLTNQLGIYQTTVGSGWTGTVEPQKPGYSFVPESRHYSRILEDRGQQDFHATKLRYKLSGNVGTEAVVMQGLPGNPVSRDDGAYEVRVEYGWSGTVTPTREGFVFQPAEKHYAPVRETQIHEDYQSKPTPPRTVEISGKIVADGMGIAGVQVLASNQAESVLTDDQGHYTLQVPYEWTGLLTPKKPGYRFDPPFLAFKELTENVDDPNSIRSRARSARPVDRPPVPSDTTESMAAEPAAGEPLSLWPNIVCVQDAPAPALEALELEQDLLTMCLILEESVRGPRLVEPLLDQDIKVIRLDGYGIVFLLKVDYPLANPVDTSAGAMPENPDKVWVQARQRLVQARYSSRRVDKLNTAKTQELQDKVTHCLGHAANIRHLSPQDRIVVSVFGLAGDMSRPTHMTIQTDMEQITCLSQGESDADAFAENLAVFTY